MSHWNRFQNSFFRFPSLPDFSVDISRMDFADSFFGEMEPLCERAFDEMGDIVAGAKVNADEDRMVGHYWLRDADLAPAAEKAKIEAWQREVPAFAAQVHSGEFAAPGGGKFENLLVIGIGGSALGPQLVADALCRPGAKLRPHFFDNTDPAGIDRVLAEIGEGNLAKTLAVVISKSGGTPETRNGMVEAEQAYGRAGIDFGRCAVAVTGEPSPDGTLSKLNQYAEDHGWRKVFRFPDWIGGRTSVMSPVGLVPAALLGVDLATFLGGAKAMDAATAPGVRAVAANPAMLLALMWHSAGGGKGAKDMVILPYKDSLELFSKYLQQLVMESLGKRYARAAVEGGYGPDDPAQPVFQGIAVYGNKGSTDQHAYVQQLRDGVNNFFATFIEVREGRAADAGSAEVEPGVTSADFLQGFLRGTRAALAESGRQSITLSIPRVDAFYLGALIALYERAVGYYAAMANINAYHQPGVEAGKKAAGAFLDLMKAVRGCLGDAPQTADAIAAQIGSGADPESVFHILNHLSANGRANAVARGASPAEDQFAAAS